MTAVNTWVSNFACQRLNFIPLTLAKGWFDRKHNDVVFDSADVLRGLDLSVIEGWCLLNMNGHTVSTLSLKRQEHGENSSWAYSKPINKIPQASIINMSL